MLTRKPAEIAAAAVQRQEFCGSVEPSPAQRGAQEA